MAEVKKVNLKSMNIPEDKLRQLKQAFPEVFTEGLKVDPDKLRLALGENVDAGRERFGMNWPGKADCFKIIQAPSVATLIPARDESINFDTTENLFIEGDNLEVLKLLQKSYYGKIKMIYVDPPYNTGSDFIYPDDYSESLDTYLRYTGQIDDQGRKYSTNAETNGRFHSKWLNMMYPRLYMARNFLREDGIFFINIGEEEVCNLEKILNEIFGEENRLSIIARVAKTASDKGTFFAPSIDFIFCYAKSKNNLSAFVDEVDESLYKKVEVAGPRIGERYRDDVALYQSSLDITRGSWSQRYFIQCPDGARVVPQGKTLPPEKGLPGDGVWRWGPDTFKKNIDLLVFKKTKTSPLLDQDGKQASWNIYTKSYLLDRQAKGTRPRNYLDEFINRKGADLIKKYGIEFAYSKPIELIQYFADIVQLKEEDIVMDFFAGSASTAHAVIEKNISDKMNLKYIMIQLPEPLDEETKSINKQFITVSDIGKERIRRVIKEIQDEQAQADLKGKLLFDEGKNVTVLDLGFKVFKLAKSNFKVWEGDIDPQKETVEKQLEMHVDHINPKSSQDDILFELLLKAGFELTTKIEKIPMAGKTVYSIEGGLMLICLEKELTKEVIKAMAEKGPSRVICLDQGFAGNDQLKTNAVQIMKSKGVEDFRTV